MRIVVVTAGSPDFKELSDVTTPGKIAYARKHGYDFYFHESTKQQGDACKFDAYMLLRDKGYDLMFWSDLDACITNSNVRIEQLLEACGADQNKHFWWGWDFNGPNSGVYFVRFSPQGHHFMERYTNNMLENGLGDNTSMIHISCVPPFSDWVQCVSGSWFNAYPYELYGADKYEHATEINKWRPGCFMAQVPGIPNEVRIPILKKLVAEAV
jgi:hypothetical protein